MDLIKLPDFLPPPPKVPDGYDRWEFRGEAWQSTRATRYAWCNESVVKNSWNIKDRISYTFPSNGVYYLEAVKLDRSTQQEQLISILQSKLASTEETISRLDDSLSFMTLLRNDCLKKLEEHADNLRDARIAMSAVVNSWLNDEGLHHAMEMLNEELRKP